jgi:2-desacetyl-2-hydroxyethyl bacteriochlorophyllide A dehydrogenase
VRAALLTTIPAHRFEAGELPDPVPGPGELLLDVLACGICGTDLHILEGRSYKPELPFVLGHEPVGRVIAVGSSEDSQWLGRRVTITLFTGDGTCAWCRAGDERLCPAMVSITGVLKANGGFAERLVVRTAQVLPVPDSLSDDEAASLVDAGATAANSVRVANAAKGTLTVIVGGGPIGFLAAELLRAAGRESLIVQTSAPRREALAAIGHRVAASIDDVHETPGVVIDAAAAPEVLPWSLDVLEPHGTYVAAGYGSVEHLNLAPLARKEVAIVGVRSGRRDDLAHIVALAAAGTIRLPPISRWRLGAINDALVALRERHVPGKAVIGMHDAGIAA